MKRFSVDRQTLDDLSVFGKRGQESIYGLFNRTYTHGGAKLLEQWFVYPLSGREELIGRNNNIRYFYEEGLSFPFDSSWFEIIEAYLSDRDARSQLRGEDNTLGRKLGSVLGADTHYKGIQKAVVTTGKLLDAMCQFIEHLDQKQDLQNTFEGTHLREVKSILAEEEFVQFYQVASKDKLSYDQVTFFDRFIRFSQQDKMRTVLNFSYWLDVTISVASVARESGFAFAQLAPEGSQELDIQGMYHPMVKGAIGNDVKMKEEDRVLFLTGANMAGKSTFMKSLGIAFFLAHIGLPVPARSMVFAMRDGLFTTINLADNLEMGHSHFYAEVLRVKQVSHELAIGKQLLVIFDELFRGTNVKDAYEATVAITEAYTKIENCVFVVSTHIMEAAEELRVSAENIRYVYLPTKMEGNKPVYTYQLMEGVTSDRHGMLIIENEEILEILANGNKGGRYE